MDGPVFAARLTCAHHGFAHLVHNSANIGKIKVDKTRANHQVSHTFYALIQNIIRHAESIGECRVFIGKAEEVLVWNDNQGVDNLLQSLNALFRLAHTFTAFKLEGFCHHTHCQDTQFAGRLRNNWSRTRTGAAAHTCCDKAHMCPSQLVHDLLNTFFGCGSANCGFSTGTQTFSDFDTHLDFNRGFRLLQSLRIGVCNNKFNTFKLLVYHIIDSITACAPNTEYGDAWFQVVMSRHG